MPIINVNVPGAEYQVVAGNNALHSLAEFITSKYQNKKNFYVIDEQVLNLHRGMLLEVIPGISNDNMLVLHSSEKNKSTGSVELIYQKLISAGAGRDAAITGIGGGIVGDITGFAAASYMRGISYIQVPTTLLSIVDSSVGGKTGVNFNGIKNIVGAFYQPEAVFADYKFLDTLENQERICGLGEIVKYALLTGGEYFAKLSSDFRSLVNLEEHSLDYFITESIKYKADVVAQDEKEAGLRKVLNLGHTFAHGLETALDFKLKHGQAVIAGVSCAIELSSLLSVTSEEDYQSMRKFINQFSGIIGFEKPDHNSMLTVMGRDKKNRDGKIKFVLPVKPGEVLIDVEAETDLITESINRGLEPFVNSQ